MVVFKKISSISLLILTYFYVIVSCSVLHNPEMLKEYQLFLNRMPRPFTYALKEETDLYPINSELTYTTLPARHIYKNDKLVQIPVNTANTLSTSNVLLDNRTDQPSSVLPSYIDLPAEENKNVSAINDKKINAPDSIVIANPALSFAMSRNQDNIEHVKTEDIESTNTDAISNINDEQSLKRDNKKLTQQKVLQRPLAFSYYDNYDNKQQQEDGHVSGTEIDHQESIIDAKNTNSEQIQPQIIKQGGEDNKQEKKTDSDYKNSEDKVQYASHNSTTGEKQNKGYKDYDEYTQQENGHHNHEQHEGNYDDKGGKKEARFHEYDYHHEHHRDKLGKKEEKFEEDGEHEKGHSTNGSHIISKKDHFEQKDEFFDEFYEDDEDEKNGSFYFENDNYKGGKEKTKYHQSGEHENKYDKKGFLEKGNHNNEDKGHKKQNGHSVYYANEHKYGETDGKDGKKKWGYYHGNKHDHNKYKQQIDGIRHSNPKQDDLENYKISSEETIGNKYNLDKETNKNLNEEIKDDKKNNKNAEKILNDNKENIDNSYKVYENRKKDYDQESHDDFNKDKEVIEKHYNKLVNIDEESSKESSYDKNSKYNSNNEDYVAADDLLPKEVNSKILHNTKNNNYKFEDYAVDENSPSRDMEKTLYNDKDNIDNSFKVYKNYNKNYNIKEDDHFNKNSEILENYRNDNKKLDYIDEQSNSKSNFDKSSNSNGNYEAYIETEDLTPKETNNKILHNNKNKSYKVYKNNNSQNTFNKPNNNEAKTSKIYFL